MIEYNMPWKEYLELDAMNGSTLSHILTSPLQLKHVVENKIQPRPSVTRPGTAIHSIAEWLPLDVFEEHYIVMPAYELDDANRTDKGKKTTSTVTKYVKEKRAEFEAETAEDEREVLMFHEFRNVVRMAKALSDNGDILAMIMDSQREVTVTDWIWELACKGRIDGITSTRKQWNLKSCTQGIDKWSFGRVASDCHYLFKDAMHWHLMRLNGETPRKFSYFAIDNCPFTKETQSYARPCQVIEITVGIEKLDSMADEVEQQIARYQKCMAGLSPWTGEQNYEYEPMDRDLPGEPTEEFYA